MATANKALNTPARGSNQNTWDVPLNANFNYIDAITAATYAAAFVSSNITLSATEALNLRYACTGALGGNVVLIFPSGVGGFWIIDNACTGAFTLSVRSGAGAAIVIPQGACAFVSSDGTTMKFADGMAANGQLGYAVDSGAADAYVITTPLAAVLKAGVTVRWAAANTNTGASTLNASGTGAAAIKTQAGADPVAGAIIAGGIYQSTYTGTVWQTQGIGYLTTAGGTIVGNLAVTGNITGVGNLSRESTDAGASAGPTVTLYRNSATPAASDEIGEVKFDGEDSAGNTQTYARAYGSIVDPTSTSEDGRFNIETVVAGTVATRGYVGAGAVLGTPTGGDKGAGTINLTEVYYAGVAQPKIVAQCAIDGATGAFLGNSFNMDTPTLGGSGVYTFTFLTPEADTNYIVHCLPGNTGNTQTLWKSASRSVNNFSINTSGLNSGSSTIFGANVDYLAVTVYRIS